MPKLIINGKEIEVAAGTNLIEAAKLAGAEIPHFCYHPGLSVAGNCRMCLIEIEKAPKLQIACNTAVNEGMVVFTDSDKVKKARAGVMEFLLLNHPIDCPVCDCAGECYLQDYYMEHDLNASRLEEGKNKKQKAQEIGPHVMLDKERCVLCSRCVRFTDEVSKTHELGIFGRGSTEEIGMFEGVTLDNQYSGNVVDLCPVGALTDKDFRFKSRPWFLRETETVCGGCAQGCNIVLNTNTNPWNKIGQDRAYRIYPRENLAVNQYWMCDEGRYSTKSIDHGRRIAHGEKGQLRTSEYLLARVSDAIKGAIAQGGDKIAILLSPQMTNEELWAWKWLAQSLGILQVEMGDDLKRVGAADDFLIQADKNPNSKGATFLGLGLRENVLGGKAVLEKAVQGEVTVLVVVEHDLSLRESTPLQKITERGGIVIGIHSLVQSDESNYTFTLPRAHYVEQDGSFTNIQSRVQRVVKALEPLGESLPAWEIAFSLGQRLGLEVPADSWQSIFSKLSVQVNEYSGMTSQEIGKSGVVAGMKATT